MQRTDELSESTIRRVIAATYGMVEMIDDGVGRVVDALEERGVSDRTIVVFTSDHGELLGDHGLLRKGPPPYRQVLEVPAILSGPSVPAGRRVDALTSHVDLAPTLLDLSGAAPSGLEAEGRSLLPLLEGGESAVRRAVFSEYHPRAVPELYNQTICTEHWRLTRYTQRPDWGELFHLERDPGEHENRFHDPLLAHVVRELSDHLEREFPPMPEINARRLCKW